MKMLNRDNIRQVDRYTTAQQGISSLDLMERAAEQLFRRITDYFPSLENSFTLYCGPGNNGGDGLALARLLHDQGYAVQVVVVQFTTKYSSDFEANFKSISERIRPVLLNEDSELPGCYGNSVIIDAVFGIGLNRTPAKWIQNLIRHLNGCGNPIVAIDVPSGLKLDQVPGKHDVIICADLVLTLGIPKLALCLPQAAPFVKNVQVLDIGLDQAFIESIDAPFEWVDLAYVRKLYRPRLRFTHKGTYGHVLIIGGSKGKIGAPILAAKSSLASGAGLVTAWVPTCGLVPFQSAFPEAMVQCAPGKDYLEAMPQDSLAYTLVVGMGMGQHPATGDAFISWLSDQRKPVVLDADALNLLSVNRHALLKVPKQSVLTPHPGELGRLIGPWENDFEKMDLAREFSSRYQVVLVIKGAHTLIFNEGKGYVNSSGNPGMATAGSGDVLSGVIGSLLAQGYPPLHAAQMGVFLHGLAGDLMSERCGQEGLTASVITAGLGKAFQKLYTKMGEGDSFRKD